MVAVLVAITAAYCWGLGWMAYGFARAGGVVGWGLALGVTILLALTVWVTWREVLFGMAAGRLAKRFRAEHGTAADPHGEEAGRRTEFEAARDALDDEETARDWRAWFRLSLDYDALRDRRNARMALRRAIAVERAERRA